MTIRHNKESKKRGDRTMKKFVTGFVVGSLVTTAATVGLIATIKKAVIDPIEEKEAQIDESRRKAHRKSFAR